MKDNMQLVNFSELIWRKIRERQKIEGFTDEEFASILGVTVQSLKNYDKSPVSIKLDRLDKIFLKTDIKLLDLAYGIYWNPTDRCYSVFWEDAGYFKGRELVNFWARHKSFIYILMGLYNRLKDKREVN